MALASKKNYRNENKGMAQPKLLALKGLPASGKSTKAAELTKQGWIRSNKDTIRELLFAGNYKKSGEKLVVQTRNHIISAALSKGKNVVVDDTNLNPVHIKDLQNLAKKHNAIFEIDDSFLRVPIEVCIKRDLQRPKSVGENVIRQMYNQYVKRPKPAYEYDANLPMAIIVDIDGTLAHMDDGRGPFDWHKVGQDRVDEGVAHLVDAIGCIDYAKVFLFSGRDEVCRPETEEWLERHDIEYFKLAMRRTDHVDNHGNQVKDTEVKREMLEHYIKGQYNVLFIVDDRPQVANMWRDEFGFRVLQVGDPYYNF